MAGMVSGLDRKNCWTIAEHRGAATPDGLQHLLARASWDADAVSDDLRDYVIDAFGDPGAILAVHETGNVKKGTATVGVQRQYSSTAGRIENSQVAVYLTYAAPRGHALPFIKAAIAAGKDVYSEWPLSTTTAASEELLRLAEAGIRGASPGCPYLGGYRCLPAGHVRAILVDIRCIQLHQRAVHLRWAPPGHAL